MSEQTDLVDEELLRDSSYAFAQLEAIYLRAGRLHQQLKNHAWDQCHSLCRLTKPLSVAALNHLTARFIRGEITEEDYNRLTLEALDVYHGNLEAFEAQARNTCDALDKAAEQAWLKGKKESRNVQKKETANE